MRCIVRRYKYIDKYKHEEYKPTLPTVILRNDVTKDLGAVCKNKILRFAQDDSQPEWLYIHKPASSTFFDDDDTPLYMARESRTSPDSIKSI